MSTTTTTGKNKSEELDDRMGVASISSNKRRLENPDDGDEDYVIAAKVAKKATAVYVESAAEVQDTIGHENSSDFLTTSILARTLLTSTATGVTSQLSYSPLESLSSTLEALPAPSLLLDTGVSESEIRSTFLPFKTTIQEATELEFTSLLCHERTLSTVTVLSPIDEDSSDWSSVVSGGSGGNSNGSSSVSAEVRQGTKISNGCTMSNVMSDQQVITEDETGKSYFNLGSADTTLLVKKSPPALPPTTGNNISNGGGGGPHQNPNHQSLNHNNNNHHHHHQHHQQQQQQQQHGSPIGVVVTTNSGPSVTDQSWMNGCNNSTDFIDDGSSSSCESISSEDLFTSEEFDASEDEEEIRTYKQQRSTVLHISLCKLNSFRTQQCVEPSLHRSVLICNTLRHIEQEIRSEDEIPMRNVGRGGGGGNNQPLPPFWASSPNNPNPNGSNGNNNPNSNPNTSPSNNSNNNSNPMVGNVSPVVLNQASQQQMTDIRPNQNQAQGPIQNQNQNQPHVASLHGGHDPYLSPLPNSYSPNNTAESPYSTYDYNSLRPNPTPFHTASYDYTEQDLSLVSGSPGTAQILDVSSPPSLLECDSGYAEDLNLSSYYYNTNPSPGPPPQQIPSGPPRPGTPRNGLAVNVNVNSHSIQIPIQQQVPGSNENNGANNVGVGVGVGNPNVNTNDSSYLTCGYNNLNLVGDSSVVGVGVGMSPTCSNNGTDSLLSDTSSLLSSTSDMSDIEMLSPVPVVTAPGPAPVSNNSGDGLPPSSPVAMPISVVDSRAPTNCDYNNLLVNNSNSNNVIADSSTIESSSSSDNSLSPPPQQMNDLSLNLNCVSAAIAPPLSSNPNPNPNSGLCWSKIPNSNPLSCPNNSSSSGSNNSKEMIPLNNSTNSQQHNNNNNNNSTTAFIQQESHQCGMESRLSEFSRSHSNFTNPHHHNLPMDSLISANYSNSL